MTTLAKAKAMANKTFTVQASLMIVTYDHQNIFIVQATDQILEECVEVRTNVFKCNCHLSHCKGAYEPHCERGMFHPANRLLIT